MFELIVVRVTVIVLFNLVVWHSRTYDYICQKCGHRFSIRAFKDFISPHLPNGKKYLKRPKKLGKANQ